MKKQSVELRNQRNSSTSIDHEIACAAHDLCNHLQVISGALGLIQRMASRENSASVKVVLKEARSSLERANRLSRQIVDRRGFGHALDTPVSIGERLVGLREVLLLIAGPAILVEFLVDDDIPDVLCSAEALDDALLNIVGNAALAMPDGGRIAISLEQEASVANATPAVVLRIADTGCGMSEEVAERAFDPRFTTRAPSEGSGIGLAMVANFSRSAGGSAELNTCQDVGTVVTLRLPGVPRHVRIASGEPAGPGSM